MPVSKVLVMISFLAMLVTTGCDGVTLESPEELLETGCDMDRCSVCDLDTANDCKQDCRGDWGGTATEDCAGVCGGEGVEDCEGTCNGEAVEDCKGDCGGEAVADCAGECDGEAFIDCTGACGGGALVDCAGVCGGSKVEDCAEVCGGSSVEDCAGFCGGSAVVDCVGTCNGSAVKDCFDVCNGSAVKDCLGTCDGQAVEDCAGTCGGSWVKDCAGDCNGTCGECDAAPSCLVDCAGVWNDAAKQAACGVCESNSAQACEAVCADDPCNGGTCTPMSNTIFGCTCASPKGGAVCSDCAPGFYGEGCVQQCPGGASDPCNGNGTCDDGVRGSGSCECSSGWTGAACSYEIPLVIERVTSEDGQFNSVGPRVSIGGNGAAYLVWQKCSGGDQCNKRTVMASRHGGAAGWGVAVEISPGSIRSANGTKPDVAVDSAGLAHIIWHDTGTVGSRISETDILYRTWDGTNVVGLGSVATVSVGSGLQCATSGSCIEVYEARIALLSDSPRVVFRADGSVRDFEAYYATLSGAGWSATQVSSGSLDSPADSGQGVLSPGIAIDSAGGVHLLWRNKQSQTASSLHYHRVLGSGTVAVPLVCEPGRVFYPSIAVAGAGKVHVAWTGDPDCNDLTQGYSIYYSVKDETTGFGTPVEVTKDSSLVGANHNAPQIVFKASAGQSPQLGVSWSSNAAVGQSGADTDILFQRFSEGASQAGLKLLSEPTSAENVSSAASVSPSMASDAAGIMACWQEKDTSSSPDYDIFCTRLNW